MVTRRDFLKTMSMASAGLALGTGDLLHAQTASPKKGRGDKVKIAYIGIGNRGEQIIEDFARTGMVEVVILVNSTLMKKELILVTGMGLPLIGQMLVPYTIIQMELQESLAVNMVTRGFVERK